MAPPSLDSLREELGQPPRKLGWFTEPPIAMPMPDWMRDASVKDEQLKGLFGDLKDVWKHGEIRWGRIIKANRLLYSPGADDCPAEMLFSLTASDEEAVPLLREYVDRLWELVENPPGRNLTERESEWEEDLQNDMSYHAGFKLPPTWMPTGQEFRGSAAFFHRPHLPGGFISHRLMPVLVLPRMPYWTVVVPVSFWPPELREWLDANEAVPKQQPPPLPLPPPLPGANPMETREAAYCEVFGKIDSVFHEMDVRPPHVDVYAFLRDDEGPFWTMATGGMSDADQPNAADPNMQRVELVFHVREKTERFANLVRNFAHYPFETGNAIEGRHTIPLGDHAEAALGTARFNTLFFLPAMRSCDNALAGKAVIDGQPVYPLMVIPITERELSLVQEKGPREFLDRLKASGFGPIFEPERPCCGGL